MIPNIYSDNLTVYSSLTDVNSNIRFDAVLSIFQDLTTEHSALMKVDHDNLISSSNAYWVLSKIKFKISGNFKTGDKILGSTWPLKPGLVRFLRDYKITANNGEIDGKSEWCVLDANTLSLRKSTTVEYADINHLDNRANVSDFSRLNEQVDLNNLIYRYKTLFTDIDCNNHVNNLSYAKMALNAFDLNEFASYNFNAFEIHFISQTYFNNEIDIYKKQTENGVYIEGKLSDKTVFKCLFYNE